MGKPLIGCNNAPYNGKVYLIDAGRRRWIKDASVIKELGYAWPNDVEWVTANHLKEIPLGPEVPRAISKKQKIFKKKTMQDTRESLVASMTGKGMEFGAAANPLPIPLGVKIKYADIVSKNQLEDELYQKDSEYEYVESDIISSFDDMRGIAPNSLDFIIGSHVIEHVRDPIKTLELAWQKLRKNGQLALIVPKYERTLDHKRAITTLDHLIEDYTEGNRYRDLLHVAEFYTYAKPVSTQELYEKMVESITDEYHSMHYHVWNEKAFNELLKYVAKRHSWKVKMNKPALPGSENYEFYVLLQKT